MHRGSGTHRALAVDGATLSGWRRAHARNEFRASGTFGAIEGAAVQQNDEWSRASDEPGEMPAFELVSHRGETIAIGGRPLRSQLVVFVPMAFTPVCGAELDALGGLAPDAEAAEVDVLVVSCDSPAVLSAWFEHHGAPEVLTGLSDFWPHGRAARAFGVFDPLVGHPERVTIGVHRDGRSRLVARADAGQPRRLKDHLRGIGWLATR